MLKVGKVIEILDGEVEITAVAGTVPASEDDSTYGAKPPLMV